MGAFTNQFWPRFHLTLEEAAARFGITQQELQAAIRTGRLRSQRAMHLSWVSPAAVTAFLARDHVHATRPQAA
ncbi:MAG TPA: hypothetical protein VNM48_01830 [Chloroflexota bacterium]|nr:hypothetical protein [Chloroflexota bacterium]